MEIQQALNTSGKYVRASKAWRPQSDLQNKRLVKRLTMWSGSKLKLKENPKLHLEILQSSHKTHKNSSEFGVVISKRSIAVTCIEYMKLASYHRLQLKIWRWKRIITWLIKSGTTVLYWERELTTLKCIRTIVATFEGLQKKLLEIRVDAYRMGIHSSKLVSSSPLKAWRIVAESS